MSNTIKILFGGTFDPVHTGHLFIAQKALEFFKARDLAFIPCKNPLLKPNALAPSHHRINMLKLAIHNNKQFYIDRRECDRLSPSYMVETLRAIRQSQPEYSLILLMGQDAFLNLPQWHEWQKLLDYAHIVVVNRPHLEFNVSQELKKWLDQHLTQDPSQLHNHPQGYVFNLTIPEQDVSSTDIRHEVGKYVNKPLDVTPEVLSYIKANKLYR